MATTKKRTAAQTDGTAAESTAPAASVSSSSLSSARRQVPRTDPTGQYIYDTHLIIPPTAREDFPVLGHILLLLIFGIWYNYLPIDAKLRSIVAAAAFSVIEFTFYSVSIETVAGDILIRPFDSRCRKGHTTWEQFFANILYTPLLLEVYPVLIAPWWLRIALYPLNIWLLEIVEGYFLTFLYGYNPAWTYRGRDVMFGGNIKLSYAPFWFGLGAVVEVLLPYVGEYSRALTSQWK
ncbi:hypothetical protein HDU88_003459 [Geranomyces variabilis]|nr:hypothetical protein HDU88_003459 [Geranomyces variabilis]